MLIIDADQMQAIEAQIEKDFARRLAHTLNHFFPFRYSDNAPATREEFALTCIRHAKRLGLRTEGAITRYANVCALAGIGFEATPFAKTSGLAPEAGETLDPVWLDRVVAAVQRKLR